MPQQWLQKILPAALIAGLCYVVIYKAVNLPLTYDEVITWQRYTSYASFSDVMLAAEGSTNNHILNSLLVKCSMMIFGDMPLALRLPNVLAFFVFTACLFPLAERFFNRSAHLYAVPFLFILLNPYLLDFFSLARGYGLALAFASGSIIFLLLFAASKQLKCYYVSFAFSLLAAYANFTFLIFWAAAQVILLASLLAHKYNRSQLSRVLLITVIVNVFFAGLCYMPLKNTHQCMMQTFGDRTGFFHDTVVSSVSRFACGHPLFGLSYSLTALLISLVVLGLLLKWLHKMRVNPLSVFTSPYSLVFLLSVLVVAFNLVEVYFFKTPYLSGRTAIVYPLLFSFLLLFAFHDRMLSTLFSGTIGALGLSLLLAWHFKNCLTLDAFYEWSFDAYTYQVMDYIKGYHQQHPNLQNVELNMTSFLNPSFLYYNRNHPYPWLILDKLQCPVVDTTSTALFYYTTTDQSQQLKNYTEVKRFVPTGMLSPGASAQSAQVLLMHN